MDSAIIKRIVAMVVILLIAIGIALAGSQNGLEVAGIPIFALEVALAFIIQWIVFIPSFLNSTEKFFDLTGSITYLTVVITALVFAGEYDTRSVLLTILIGIWAARLGSFLFMRIRQAGEDIRFREIKVNFTRFLVVWTLQGLWITFTAAAAIAAITAASKKEMGIIGYLGVAVWIIGFGIEVIADTQKSRFRANPDNKGKFINTGLWAWSRHPNYFGEIVLWVGIAIIAIPVLQGWQFVTLISPIFVTLLLTRISGVPMLEKKADERWGGQEDYEQYKANTSVLIMIPPKK